MRPPESVAAMTPVRAWVSVVGQHDTAGFDSVRTKMASLIAWAKEPLPANTIMHSGANSKGPC